MSPRTRITTTVDVDVDHSPRPGPRTGSKSTKFWVNPTDTAMLTWLKSQPNESSAIRDLIEDFVRLNGTGDLVDHLPDADLAAADRDKSSGVVLTKRESLKWLANQRGHASASVRYVIHQHLDALEAAAQASARRRRPSTVGVRISWDDTDLLAWLGADGNASRAMTIAINAFVESKGFPQLDVTSPIGRYNGDGQARSISTQIEDECVAKWLSEQTDTSAALRHVFRWYIENHTVLPVKHVGLNPVETVSTTAMSRAIGHPTYTQAPSPAPVSNPSSRSERLAQLLDEVTDTSERDRRLSSIEKQLAELAPLTTAVYALSGQINQLMPGAHRVTS